MKKLWIMSVVFGLLLFSCFYEINVFTINADNYELVIYTYESLLADPGYDFVEGFANHSGIAKEDIHLVLLEDANSIVTQAALEKNNPVADVLIGLDNVLIHKAKEEGILEPYNSPELVNVSSDLISNLDPMKHILPYDYGIIALWYDNSRINSTSNPELDTLKLQDIIDENLDEILIVEDPTLSSPGLGFLLWTIAVYGDPSVNFDGLLKDDWRNWWKSASKNLRIAPSWGAAFDIYYTEEENRPMMVSYGTSPAYDVCHPLWGVGSGSDPPSTAIVSHENGTENAWLQIEGLGLVKNAPNQANAQSFIDWFLSAELQDNIPTNNWMYPANVHANISSCFMDSAINPADVNILNDLITPTMLEENLDMWKNDWETEIASFSSIFLIILTLSFSAITYIFLRKKRE